MIIYYNLSIEYLQTIQSYPPLTAQNNLRRIITWITAKLSYIMLIIDGLELWPASDTPTCQQEEEESEDDEDDD